MVVVELTMRDKFKEMITKSDKKNKDKNTNTKSESPISMHLKSLEASRYKFDLPKTLYSTFFNDANKAIDAYNTAKDSESKKNALKDLQGAIEHVELRATPEQLAKAHKFNTIKAELFTQIKSAYSEQGVNTLYEGPRNSNTIAYVLSDMQQNEMDKLTGILLGNKNQIGIKTQKLDTLYGTEDQSKEAKQWRDFIKKHSIEFLGGGNSKNFKVTNIQDGSVKVLKVDNRLNMPRLVDKHLRDNLESVFTPVDVARQVLSYGDSRTLLVTDLCSSGSMFEHSQKISQTTLPQNRNQALHKEAINIGGQMAQAFQDIQKTNCFFPDGKLTNWLVDGEGKLRIADTKSFLFTDNGYSRLDVEGTAVLVTQGFQPTEYGMTKGPYQADSFHAYLLGCNLYKYLTGISPPLTGLKLDNLNSPVFDGDGKKLKELITSLVEPKPKDRISLKEAQYQLQILNDPDFKKVVEATQEVSATTGIKVSHVVADMFLTQRNEAGYSKDTTIQNILTSLDEFKTNCPISSKEKSQSYGAFISENELNLARKRAIGNETSFDAIWDKLKAFDAVLDEYKTTRSECLNLKFGEKDKQIDERLSDNDRYFKEKLVDGESLVEISQDTKELNVEINKFNTPDIQLVRSSINALNAIYKRSEAREIAEAMQKVPANERANVFESKDPSALKLRDTIIKSETARYKDAKTELSNLKYGENDIEMNNYLKRCDKQFEELLKEGKLVEASKYTDTLCNKTAQLKKPENIEIRKIIENFKANDSLFSIGMGTKAHRIEEAMQKVPVEDRFNLLSSTDPSVTGVLKAIASHRISFTSSVTEDNKINSENSATAFKAFKTRFSKEMKDRTDIKQDLPQHASEKFKPGR